MGIEGYSVSNVTRDTRHDGFGHSVEGWSATLTAPDGTTFHVSQLEGETDWIVDALFGANGYPHWSHGFGCRYVRCQALADAGAELVSAALAAR